MRCGAADFGSTGPQRLKLKICGFRSGANEIIQPALRALGLSLSDGAPTVGRGKTFHLKLGSYGKNWIFGPKNEILGPKKGIHFLGLAMFWPRLEKVVQRKKVPLPK